MRHVFTLAGVMLLAGSAASAQPGDANTVGKPFPPGAFFISTGPNPFAGPFEAVADCKFFSSDIDRKVKGCGDLIADAAGEPRADVVYVKVEARRDPKNLAAAHYDGLESGAGWSRLRHPVQLGSI
jgi:hypothetical protein